MLEHQDALFIKELYRCSHNFSVLYPPWVIPYGFHGMVHGFHKMADGFHELVGGFHTDSIPFPD